MNTLYNSVWNNTDDFTAEPESPMFDLNTHTMEPPLSCMCFTKRFHFFAKITIIKKTIYNLDYLSLYDKEESKDVYNVCRNVMSLLMYVQQLGGKIDALIQNNNSVYINETNDFEKIFPFKHVGSVDDMEIKLKLDQNFSNQLVFMILL